MKKRIIILASIFIAIFALASAYLPGVLENSAKKAEADTTPSFSIISGFLWSSNTGWIKLNPGSTKDVKINDISSTFTGFAWSSNLGWINFAPTNIPSTFANPHVVKLEGDNVTGWARACSVLASADCTGTALKPSTVTGGWDGWIKMVNVTLKTPTTPTIPPPTKVFAGYAWGDLNLGWIDFSLAGAPGTSTPICTGCCGPCGGGPTVTCTATDATHPGGPYYTGDLITWTATPNPTGSSYTYNWEDGSSNGSLGLYSGHGSSFQVAYSNAGTYTPKVTVVETEAEATCQVVGDDGIIITPTPSYTFNCVHGKIESVPPGQTYCPDTSSGFSVSDNVTIPVANVSADFFKAVADTDYVLGSWGGSCLGTSPTINCSNPDPSVGKIITANFVPDLPGSCEFSFEPDPGSIDVNFGPTVTNPYTSSPGNSLVVRITNPATCSSVNLRGSGFPADDSGMVCRKSGATSFSPDCDGLSSGDLVGARAIDTIELEAYVSTNHTSRDVNCVEVTVKNTVDPPHEEKRDLCFGSFHHN